jgi:hypothetical protein
MNATTINLKFALLALTAVAAASFYVGYKAAPREILDSVVEHAGFLKIDTKQVLSATIESLKSESNLVSYSYVGTQNVSIDRSAWYVFNGSQQLIVPANVSYFVDLSKLTSDSATFDEASNTVSVLLPKLMLAVNFDPRKATKINAGLLTMNDATVQALEKLNYETALKSAIKQGQQAELIRLARERTLLNIERLFRVPLRLTGKEDVKVIVMFPN